MSLSSYYEQICKEPLLDKDEERDLFLEYQDPGLPASRREEIKERIIRANLRFVFKQAKHYSKNDPLVFEELIAVGNEGLLVGMQKFRPQDGVKFLTYAGWWVKQRILKHLGTMRIVSLPTWKQQLAAKIQKICDSDPDITFEKLQEVLPDVPVKYLSELFQTRYLTYYIEDIGEDPAFEINPIEDHVEQKLDNERVHRAIESLPSPHREVVIHTFGFLDGEEMKQGQVAELLNLSKEEIKSIKQEALEMLQEAFGGENPFA